MPRPRNCRRVGSMPGSNYFKPRGVPLSMLEEVVLSVDEFEAIRLADLEGLYQEQAAERMKVSRQTFGRIIESAHKKVAEVLVTGKALKIEGGAVEMASMRRFRCDGCRHSWEIPYGTGKPGSCPACQSGDVRRAENKGSAGGPGRRQGRCFCGNKNNNNKKGENS
ncbi:MAG TPA: DUF134 domain-containing protein [Syntrophales bacterium]|nr:DUF134 domain-containing protein [Syntrophales bacterium]